MNIKFILKFILAFILFLATGGVFIFDIIWGCSLLASEFKSPGSVLLSTTILYIFFFYISYIITKFISYIALAIWEEAKEEYDTFRKRWRD